MTGSASSSWPKVRLGDVAEHCLGKMLDAAKNRGRPQPYLRNPNVRWFEVDTSEVRLMPFEDHENERYGLRKGDVLVCEGGEAGRAAIWDGRVPGMKFQKAIHRVRPRAELDGRFLVHRLRADYLSGALADYYTGATIKHLTGQDLARYSFPLPPLTEQRRIAAILDQADVLRAKRREALAQLDSLAQSIFIEMFGDPVSNPMRWPMEAFGQICETRLGKMLDEKQRTGRDLRPYLRNANVQWHCFDLSDVLEMDFDESARQVFRLRPGDLLICEGGDPGRAAVWKGEIAECYYQKALHRARPKGGSAVPSFLAWLLWFLSKRGGLGDHITSATIAHLTGEKLKAMRIVVPPYSLQQAFACRIEAIESLRATHQSALAETDTLCASLQNRAFGGQL